MKTILATIAFSNGTNPVLAEAVSLAGTANGQVASLNLEPGEAVEA
jgi:hypothetical protein